MSAKTVKNVDKPASELVKASLEPVIQVKMGNAYGNTYLYPANEQAALVCKLTGQKTIDRSKHIPLLKQLGFTVQLVPTVQTIEEL